MPVIKANRLPPEGRARQELVDELVEELSGAPGTTPTTGRPVIFELESPSQIMVVWDKWENIPQNQRTLIIMEAYEKHDSSSGASQPLAPQIMLTIGVTPSEALEMNLLPFTVGSSVYEGDQHFEAAQQAKLDEGAIEFPSGLALRFPSEEMAIQACQRLRQRIPEVFWQVSRHVSRIPD
jgi:hypothetical protein